MADCDKLKQGGVLYNEISNITSNYCYYDASGIKPETKQKRKKNYRDLLMKVHPDKNPGCKEDAEGLSKIVGNVCKDGKPQELRTPARRPAPYTSRREQGQTRRAPGPSQSRPAPAPSQSRQGQSRQGQSRQGQSRPSQGRPKGQWPRRRRRSNNIPYTDTVFSKEVRNAAAAKPFGPNTPMGRAEDFYRTQVRPFGYGKSKKKPKAKKSKKAKKHKKGKKKSTRRKKK